MATAGLAALSRNGFGFGLGKGLTLIAATFCALHIIGLGRYCSPSNAGGSAASRVVMTQPAQAREPAATQHKLDEILRPSPEPDNTLRGPMMS